MADLLLSRRDHGRTIDAPPGTTLVLTLDESPTTGYGWTTLHATDALALNGSDFEPPAALGGSGRRTLRFEVRQPGRHALALALVRPWEGEAGAIDRFALTVRTPLPD